MVYHAILGLLRDGRARHGYELVRDYRLRSGRSVNPGNVYRECSKLVSQRLIAPDVRSPDADPRRIPYRITQAGCRDFDVWLLDPKPLNPALDHWTMFAEMLPRAELSRLLDEMRESLWVDGKALGIARERAATRNRRAEGPAFQPSAFLMLRRIKQITAELEFLQELRHALGHMPVDPPGVSSSGTDRRDVPIAEGGLPPAAARRQARKGC